ncbi:hypothetical protein Tco_1382913 [Tanacetum coccineum]
MIASTGISFITLSHKGGLEINGVSGLKRVRSQHSVLVNGSPTLEFKMERGVRQGDPLSPFLNLIAAEGLNITIREAVSNGIFKGNNHNKTKVYGIGVGIEEVTSLAQRMRCAAGLLPFTYLGLPVELSSSLFRAPASIIKKLESVRQRFFWGGNDEIKKMAWVRWNVMLKKTKVGGLNIGSLKAFNWVLLGKCCMHNNDLLYDNNHNNVMPGKDKVPSEDPFNLYNILNKRKDSGDTLKYPSGFTPNVINVEEVKGATSNEVNEHVNSTSNKLEEYVPKGKLSSNNSACSKRVHTGGSILQFMDDILR